MAALSKGDIQQRLKSMSGWSHAGKAIQKGFMFKSFMEAVEFVNRVAEAAEGAAHHPDMTITYSAVMISLSTHSEGGVTDRDFELARKIDQVAATVA